MSAIHMGVGSYGSPELRGDVSDVHVGNYCSIAQGVRFDCGMHHNTKFATTYPFNAFYDQFRGLAGHPVTKGDIYIGNDVWIGEGALIMGGVTIGNGAVIGAHSIVTRNVDPYQVVAGNPAIHRAFRFDASVINRLQALAWWNWPQEKILSNVELLMNENIENLLTQHGL